MGNVRGGRLWAFTFGVVLLVAATPSRGVPSPALRPSEVTSTPPLLRPAQVARVPRAIRDLLDDYGRAYATHDFALLGRTLAPSLLGPESAALTNAAEVPFRSFRLRVDTNSSGDLTSPRIRRLYSGRRVLTYAVREESAIADESSTFFEEGVFTFVRTDPPSSEYAGYRLASKDDLDELGVFSPHHLWDEETVAVLRGPHFVILTHPAIVSDLRPLQSVAERAWDRAARFWPPAGPGHLVVVVPQSVAELGRILHEEADVSNYVAFEAASVDRSAGWRSGGPRLYVNWSRLGTYKPEVQVEVLAHELIHALTRPYSGPNVPAFVEEGLANVGGGASDLYAPRSSLTPPSDFPGDEAFVTGSVADIQAAYTQAQVAMQVLIDRFGRDAVELFYRDLGARRVVSGTERYHLERALAETLRYSLAEWLRAWRDRLARGGQ